MSNFYYRSVKMNCHSKKIDDRARQITDTKTKLYPIPYTLYPKSAFTLAETVVALIILALICSTVLAVINRCVVSAANSALRCQAFEVARENMEKLLTSNSVKETVEFGSSNRYPDVQWQTTVEAFYEPITARMWIRAVCFAQYTDTNADIQTVELTHWLTDVTLEQLLKILEQKQKEKEKLDERIIKTKQEAAEYAGVDVQTIDQWVRNGMLITENGYYIKNQLDLYRQYNGNPSIEDRNRQAQADADLIEPTEAQDKPEKGPEEQPEKKPEVKPEKPKDSHPDWLPPKEVWDAMTRQEKLAYLLSTLQW